jgi:hypothetical protein
MNPVNIIRELHTLISKLDVMPVHDDIIRCAAEAGQILVRDPVITKHVSFQWERLRPLLEALAKLAPKESKKVTAHVLPLRYFLRDFAHELERNYLAYATNELETLIAEGQSLSAIRQLTGSILSTALDVGHSLDALFSIALNVLPIRPRPDAHDGPPPFEKRFLSAMRILQSAPHEYDVVFRLEKFTRFQPELKQITPISFSKAWQWAPLPTHYEKFAAAVGPVVYAGLTVNAHDKHAAVHNGKTILGSVLDILRFEFEPQTISINDQAMVRKAVCESESFSPVKTSTVVPNPRSAVSHTALTKFIQQLNAILQQAQIESTSRKKIEAAFRYYRTGCDSLHFENKFLNWWMALEFLLSSGNAQSIVERVQRPLGDVLLQTYAKKHLDSYVGALKFCGAEASHGVQSAADLYLLLKDNAQFKQLSEQLESYPVLQSSLEWLRKKLSEAREIKTFYEHHKEKLTWHIHRIYRMRCDIVHSAAYDLKLSLLSANLEFYLKSMLDYMLTLFAENPMLNSIDELLNRSHFLTQQLLNELDDGETRLFELLLKDIPI